MIRILQDIPPWSKTLLFVLLGVTFYVAFPTVDSGTDIRIGASLIKVE